MSCEVCSSLRIAVWVGFAEFQHVKARLQVQQSLTDATRLVDRARSGETSGEKSDIRRVSGIFGICLSAPDDCVLVISLRIGGVAQCGMSEENLGIEWRKAQRPLGAAAGFGSVPHVAKSRAAAGPRERRIGAHIDCAVKENQGGFKISEQERA